MKAPVFYKIFLIPLFFCCFQLVSAQVGIGTTNARTTLEVAGDMLISGVLDIGTYNPLQYPNISSLSNSRNRQYYKISKWQSVLVTKGKILNG